MNANSKQPAPTTISSWLKSAAGRLDIAGIPSARLDAELIMAHTLEKDRTWIIAHGEDEINALFLPAAEMALNDRAKRKPLAYIFSYKEFYGRDFWVNEHVLIPRPETETLIDIAKELSLPEKSYVIDVGTGSGAIGLTLKEEISAIYDIMLVDISDMALQVAKHNNRNLFHLDKVHYLQSDLLSALEPENANHPYVNLIVANLPYVDRTWERSPETDHEPALALFADDGGIALIYKLIAQAPHLLVMGGYLLLEADPIQHEAIVTFAKKHGLKHVESRDYAVLLQKS